MVSKKKNQYKFLNNSVFHKAIQNTRKQKKSIQLITNERTRKKLASSVNFKENKQISEFFQIFGIKQIE